MIKGDLTKKILFLFSLDQTGFSLRRRKVTAPLQSSSQHYNYKSTFELQSGVVLSYIAV